MPPKVTFAGALRVTVTVSSISSRASSETVTLMSLVVSPGS